MSKNNWNPSEKWFSQYNSDILEMDDIVIDDNDFDKNELL